MLSVLAVLGVLGLTTALAAPTGTALAVADGDGVTAFSYSAQNAQTLAIDSALVEPYALAERGAFAVKAKPKPSVAGLPRYSGGGTRAEWMAAAGIAESDWKYVDYIVRRESGWNPNATNKSSGACGLVQALPCSKVPGNGYDPVDNLRWANRYATKRYGSWEKAYAFWVKNHWW